MRVTTEIMPTYFFETFDGVTHLADEQGRDLSDDKAAHDLAQSTLADMVRDALPDGDDRTFNVTIHDKTGRVVYLAELKLNGRWAEHA